MRVPRRKAGCALSLTFLPYTQTKIVLLLPLDKRQQLAEVAAGSGAQPVAAGVGSPATPPMMRGAGDGAERQEGAREREMKKILVLLLLLDARLQEGRRAAGGANGGANGGAGPGGGSKATQSWLRLYARLVTKNQASSETDPAVEQPVKRCRCPRPRS